MKFVFSVRSSVKFLNLKNIYIYIYIYSKIKFAFTVIYHYIIIFNGSNWFFLDRFRHAYSQDINDKRNRLWSMIILSCQVYEEFVTHMYDSKDILHLRNLIFFNSGEIIHKAQKWSSLQYSIHNGKWTRDHECVKVYWTQICP